MATTMTHTSGPWKIWGATIIYSESGKATVAAAGEPRGNRFIKYEDVKVGSPDFKEACANARLIAAAPDMLDLLKRVRSELIKIKWDETGPVISDISEVIAKAEGKS